MSIPFEPHFFCNEIKKSGRIILNEKNDQYLCWQLTSNDQQTYWYLSITEQDKTSYKIRPDLGRFFNGDYAIPLKFIPKLLEWYHSQKPKTSEEIQRDNEIIRSKYNELKKTITGVLEDFQLRYL